MRAIASTAYDTAWVAGISDPRDRRDPRFPSALAWLAANQLPDGSWGSPVPYPQDRIICTLAALVSLARFGRRASDRLQVERGERYLWQHAHLVRDVPCELVGFELLLPALMKLAGEAGVHVPPYLDMYVAERQAKLALLPPDLLYSPRVTLAHSLEFLGSDVNPLQLLQVQAPNGSIGNSPAATAFLLQHFEDEAAVAYLERCLHGAAGEGVPVLEPCETYETLWTAYHTFLGGAAARDTLPAGSWEHLAEAVATQGVSLSPSFPTPDADDTAVALLLLNEAGYAVEAHGLKQFERDDYFVSFAYERHASTGVNIHVLAALARCERYPGRDAAIGKILRFLDRSRSGGIYWIDKWHISPYYATSHAIVALNDTPHRPDSRIAAMVSTAIDWIVRTQHEDGAWGFYGTPTVEETAYAVMALQYSRRRDGRSLGAIDRGLHFLHAWEASPRPALWIDKCLYYPTRIVAAVIEAPRRFAQQVELAP